MKACLIGVSGFGRVHYGDLMRGVEEGNTALVAATVVNQDEERGACLRLNRLGCRLYENYEEMLDHHGGETDICFIPTGIHWHAPMTIRALQAGMNVLVEKPAAGTVQEVRSMSETARKAGRFVAVGFQTMYSSETLEMKRRLLEGSIGTIRSIKCRGIWPRGSDYYERNNWAGRLSVDGKWVLDSPFNNAMAHQLNMICFLAGRDLTSSARLKGIRAELYRANPIESTDTASLRVETEDGVALFFFVTHCAQETRHPVIEVRGEKGRLIWEYHHCWAIEKPDGSRAEFHAESGEEARASMMASLQKRLSDPGAFTCTLDIAGVHTLCVNAAHEFFPIVSIPPEHIKVVNREPVTLRSIKGVEETIQRAFEEEKLLSELTGPAVPWASATTDQPLEGYREFSGPAQ